MKTLNKSLVVEAALSALFAAAFIMPAAAQDAAPTGGDQPAPAPVKPAPAKKAANKVHCFGINSCKGKSECAVEGKSGCNGKNDCKGQGWISVSAKRCTAKKGTVLPGKAAAAPSNPEPTPAPASTPATSSSK
jgi:hypothetical protein